jgi:hypothetical protein
MGVNTLPYSTLPSPPALQLPIAADRRETLFSRETFVGRPDRQPTPNEE